MTPFHFNRVLRTIMIEEIVSDDIDTAQYSEAFLQQLNKLFNESPTAHDPKVEQQILQIEPATDTCSDEEMKSNRPKTCVIKEDEPQLQEELFFYYLLSYVYALQKYSSALLFAFVQKSKEPQ
ncbi:hypothetical protein XELAEV_18029464mg [Xenopus laevis]|uniref:Uncharacterized protein n=1 Tax=Xenopus laevis TaxID=8355 RepID=A0A974CRP3_XENLA|nr:hypothetical protein XELAEV_18029464mg [Xenopus laevis]